MNKEEYNKPFLLADSSSKKVDFLIVGAQKSGTTTLFAYLNEHPQTQMAQKKEVHFFNTDQYFSNHSPDYEYYHSWFDDIGNGDKLKGEVTPAYLYCRDAANRIWQYNPDMKIVIILRNPIERAYSHWNMEVNRGAESLDFKEALLQEAERCREKLPSQHYVYSYIDRGYYTSQIREYWRFFGRQQVLVLKYDLLLKNPTKVLTGLYGFLGLNRDEGEKSSLQEKVLHKAKYAAAIGEEEESYLLKCYRYEILQLESLLGWDCCSWRKA